MILRRFLHLACAVALLLIGGAGCTSTARRAVDTSTLAGKVMCGYQGWFNAEGDGASRGYNHWTRGGARLAGKVIRGELPPMDEVPGSASRPVAAADAR